MLETYRELGPLLARRLDTTPGRARVVKTGPCGDLGQAAPAEIHGTYLWHLGPRPKR